MRNIQKAFQPDGTGKTLIAFLVAGDPSVEKSIELILAAEAAGADLIEIGVPFSDPIAEGLVIQAANERALANGFKLSQLFDIVWRVREKTAIPLVFLTYMNPVYHYGIKRFTDRCKEAGVDGLIIPDLPFEERDEMASYCEKNDLDLITLVAPTSKARIKMITKNATGFVYCVSSMGVTGMRATIETDLAALTAAVRAHTDTPIAIGFGISSPEQAAAVRTHADGVIVGSALVKIVGEYGEAAAQPLFEFVRSLKKAITQ